jgi:hypothetical protein
LISVLVKTRGGGRIISHILVCTRIGSFGK